MLGPISSSFRWEGEVKAEREWLALLKTAAPLAGPARARIAELHPYEVPEILVTAVSDGHEPYLRWVLRETLGSSSGGSTGYRWVSPASCSGDRFRVAPLPGMMAT